MWAIGSLALYAQESDQVSLDFLANARPTTTSVAATAKGIRPTGLAATASTPGVDTIVTFNGTYNTPGYDNAGNPNRKWYYNMAGRSPEYPGTTTFNAPIIPVSIDLRNYDGSPRYLNGVRLYLDATQYVDKVVGSPVFSKAKFSTSERPTQITDAVQRAEFWDNFEDGWHTMLAPAVKTPRVMVLIRGTYRFATYSDGTLAYVLVDGATFGSLLFPANFPFTATDLATPIGAAEAAGDITTQDISTFLFPDTYLYSGDPSNCCVLGYHTYDFEPGVPENGNRVRKYVLNYSSWISPGIFGSFQDVTATSHEIAESFNDPFVVDDGVHNLTPWWLAPNGNCQNDLEVGDVIEGLPRAVYPITMPNGFTYHPQNEALLQWFEFKSPSNAIGHAYSYPDVTTLTALSPVEKVNCAP